MPQRRNWLALSDEDELDAEVAHAGYVAIAKEVLRWESYDKGEVAEWLAIYESDCDNAPGPAKTRQKLRRQLVLQRPAHRPYVDDDEASERTLRRRKAQRASARR
jgi:hypothetical protein